jgi:photosystem II stability/assembly factor-like uncharacterized protein
MPSESYEQRLRAYLDRRSRHVGDPGAVDRLIAAVFEGPASHQSRRVFATIAIAAAAALVVATPVTVFLLNYRPHTTPGPIAGQSANASPHATPVPSAPLATTAPTPRSLVPDGAAFWDAQRGLLVATPACTTGGSACPGGLIERTSDGGKTWHVVDRVSASLLAVALAGGGVGWVSEKGGSNCGAGPGSCTASTLLLTTDGGTIWRAVSSRTPVVSVSPISATAAWAVTGLPGISSSMGSTLVRSGDGGQTWQPRGNPCSRLSSVSPWAVDFAGPADGWVICIDQPATDMQAKALFTTHDGGATWQLQSDTCIATANGQVIRNTGSLSCVGYYPEMSFLSDGHGWMYAGRGSLSATSDGGRIWAPFAANVATYDVNGAISLSPVTNTTGFVLIDHSESYPACPALGCGPELLSTRDAGRSWTVVSSWTQ